MVRHDGSELELRWNTLVANVENAGGATLTITDGKHHSKLHLDPAELRSGTAYYWPQADHVGFKLETDDGAWGSLRVPAWEVQAEEPEPPAPVRRARGRKAAAQAGSGREKTGRAGEGSEDGQNGSRDACETRGDEDTIGMEDAGGSIAEFWQQPDADVGQVVNLRRVGNPPLRRLTTGARIPSCPTRAEL